jgi:hypothetical protein
MRKLPAGEKKMKLNGCAWLALLLITGCSAAPRSAGDFLAPGRYAFDGTGRVENRLRNRTETSHVTVSGTIEVLPDGRHDIMSSHGSCLTDRAVHRHGGLSVACGGMTLRISRADATASVGATRITEERGPCEEYERDSSGRPTTRCLRYTWFEKHVNTTISVPLVLTRVSY